MLYMLLYTSKQKNNLKSHLPSHLIMSSHHPILSIKYETSFCKKKTYSGFFCGKIL